MNKNKTLNLIFYISLLILLISLFFQISIGSFSMSFMQVIKGIFNYDLIFNSSYVVRHFIGDTLSNLFNLNHTNELFLTKESLIIWDIRFPRFLVGLLAGINLSCSGLIFQTITRNEMASPYILGISQGSGLSIILILMLFPLLYTHIPIIAIFGGIIAFLIIYLIAWNHGTTPIRLILAGIIIGAIASAIQTTLFLFAQDLSLIQNAVSWTSGSLIGIGWEEVRMILPYTFLTFILTYLCNRQLDLFLLGENNAKSIGILIEKWRFILAFIGVLGAGSAVSVCGLIGFVGLIAPHISRAIIGSEHKFLIPCSSIVGGTLLVVSDTLSRILFNPIQIPVGITMSIIGGIFLIILMIKRRKFNV